METLYFNVSLLHVACIHYSNYSKLFPPVCVLRVILDILISLLNQTQQDTDPPEVQLRSPDAISALDFMFLMICYDEIQLPEKNSGKTKVYVCR